MRSPNRVAVRKFCQGYAELQYPARQRWREHHLMSTRVQSAHVYRAIATPWSFFLGPFCSLRRWAGWETGQGQWMLQCGTFHVQDVTNRARLSLSAQKNATGICIFRNSLSIEVHQSSFLLKEYILEITK